MPVRISDSRDQNQHPFIGFIVPMPPIPAAQQHFLLSSTLSSANMDKDHLRFADYSCNDHQNINFHPGDKRQNSVSLQDFTSLLSSSYHPVGFSAVHHYLFIHRDMLASLADKNYHQGIFVVGNQQLDQIDRSIIEHYLRFA